jgi:predicted RNase H-like HicB family nuclease
VKEYLVVIEPAEDGSGFGALVPDLPGCVAAAKTREETVKLIRESIPMHIASLVANGEPVPPPAAQVERVTVAA